MKRSIIFAGALMSAFCMTAPYAIADEAAKTAEVKAVATQVVTGVLDVIKDDAGAVTSASIAVISKDGDDNDVKTVYNVVLDEIGKAMTKDMADKKVEATAVLAKKEVATKNDEGETEKKTELWLTVKSFKAVVEKVESED